MDARQMQEHLVSNLFRVLGYKELVSKLATRTLGACFQRVNFGKGTVFALKPFKKRAFRTFSPILRGWAKESPNFLVPVLPKQLKGVSSEDGHPNRGEF